MAVSMAAEEQQATLNCVLALGELEPGSPAGRPELSVTLHWSGAVFGAGIAGGGLEEALDRIGRQLPDGARLHERPLVGA